MSTTSASAQTVSNTSHPAESLAIVSRYRLTTRCLKMTLHCALLIIATVSVGAKAAGATTNVSVGTAAELITAIENANASPDDYVITLQSDIELTAVYDGSLLVGGGQAGLPDITSDITIEAGAGSTIRRSDESGVADFRIIYVGFTGSEPGRLVLDGVTIENGFIDAPDNTNGAGGCIYVDSGEGLSGNIELTLSASTVQNCTVEGGNRVQSNAGSGLTGSGGGILIAQSTTTTISASTITGNTARGGDAKNTGGHSAFGGDAKGGGIYVSSNDDSAVWSLTDSFVTSNSAIGGTGKGNEQPGGNASGGGIYASKTNLTSFSGNEFVGNSAERGSGNDASASGANALGGGLYLVSELAVTLSDSLFSENTASGLRLGVRNGGGMYLSPKDDLVIDGLRILNNAATTEGGGIYRSYHNFRDKGTFTMTNSCIVGNSHNSVYMYNSSFNVMDDNYWGSDSGPYAPNIDPVAINGLGDSADGRSTINTFLTTAPFPDCGTTPRDPIALTKTFVPDEVSVPETSSVEITIGNPNPIQIAGLLFTDRLPSGLVALSVTSNTCWGEVLIDPNTEISLDNGSVDAAPGSCTIRVTVEASQPGTYTNPSFEVFRDGTTTINGTAAAVDLIVREPEVEVTDSANSPIRDEGSTFSFPETPLTAEVVETFTVSNAGAGTLNLVDPPTVTGDFSVTSFAATAISAGASTTFEVSCDATTLGLQTGTVSFENNDLDESPFTFGVSCEVTERETDLAVSLSDDPDPVGAGQNLTYTATLTNNGPSVSTGATVTDVLPAGVFFSSSSDCTAAAGTVTCTISALNAGASQDVSFVVSLDPGQSGVISNTATVTGTATDLVSGNDSATSTTTVDTDADPSINMNVDEPAPWIGEQVTYTLTVTNDGPGIATGVMVEETLPTDVAYVSDTPSQGTWDGSTWTVGTLATAGSAATLSITVRIEPGQSSGGTITNFTRISSLDQNDPDPSNNEDDVTINYEMLDFGDAPDPFDAVAGQYPTLLANDGARHAGGGTALRLGALWDAEHDAQVNADATGDDGDGVNDEDGITFATTVVAGSATSVDVDVTDDGTAGQLNAWIDWNHNGSWSDAGEQIAANVPAPAVNGTQTITLNIAVPIDADAGLTMARFRLDSGGSLLATGPAADGEVEDHLLTVLQPTIFYVDIDASNNNDGSSWDDAFTSLQDALAVAVTSDQIWVAEGVYYPDLGTAQIDNDVNSTFTVPNGVKIYGGFNGTETAFAERDVKSRVTILSGDIDENDSNDDSNFVAETWTDLQGANAYHLMTATGTDATTILDGLTMTAGWAAGSGLDDEGAVIVCDGASPSLNNLMVIGNHSNDRAALRGCTSTVSASTFDSNYAGDVGAVATTATTWIDTVFINNRASSQGAVFYLSSGTQTMTNCEFR